MRFCGVLDEEMPPNCTKLVKFCRVSPAATDRWPCQQASQKGVRPSMSAASTSTPSRSAWRGRRRDQTRADRLAAPNFPGRAMLGRVAAQLGNLRDESPTGGLVRAPYTSVRRCRRYPPPPPPIYFHCRFSIQRNRGDGAPGSGSRRGGRSRSSRRRG